MPPSMRIALSNIFLAARHLLAPFRVLQPELAFAGAPGQTAKKSFVGLSDLLSGIYHMGVPKSRVLYLNLFR